VIVNYELSTFFSAAFIISFFRSDNALVIGEYMWPSETPFFPKERVGKSGDVR
jgi:hypothetical protein